MRTAIAGVAAINAMALFSRLGRCSLWEPPCMAIASDFACILTVTHMPHLKEAFQARIEVSKTQQVALRALCARKLEAIAKVPVPLGQSRDSYFSSATPKCKSTHVCKNGHRHIDILRSQPCGMETHSQDCSLGVPASTTLNWTNESPSDRLRRHFSLTSTNSP